MVYKTRSTGGAALPRCAADGKRYKEALANVEIIIQEWIETAKELGRPIPAPRGHPPQGYPPHNSPKKSNGVGHVFA